MTSADTPQAANPDGPKDDARSRETRDAHASDELANFAVLADPDTIAGTQTAIGGHAQYKIERENNDLVVRLRAELQRRARQVENLSRDLSSTQTAKTDTEARLRKLNDEMADTRNSTVDRGGLRQPPPDRAQATNAGHQPNAAAHKPFASALPVSDETGSLRRLLHAAHDTRRALEEQLAQRDSELAKTRTQQETTRKALHTLQQERESQAEERAQLQSLKSRRETQDAEIQGLAQEGDKLRRSLVLAQREAAEAEKTSQRTKDAMGDTRNRVTLREAEANALRAALATNQMQAQARGCENEELRAALSIARETLESRRGELKASKIELAAATERLQRVELRSSALDNELAAQRELSGEQSGKLTQMNLTLPRLEQNLSDRTGEIAMLRDRLDELETEVARLRESLTQTQIQRDSLADDLATEQEALVRARSRGVEREATLATLRETLTSIGKAATVLPVRNTGNAVSPAANRQAESLGSQAAPAMGAESASFSNDAAEVTATDSIELRDLGESISAARVQSSHELDETKSQDMAGRDATDISESVINTDSANSDESTDSAADTEVTDSAEHASNVFEPTTGPGTRHAAVASNATDDPGLGIMALIPPRKDAESPAMFRSWRDKQIAKKLAPLGISGVDDFFVESIAPQLEANREKTIHVLSLGGSDAEFELRIAQGLRQRGHDSFLIHFPESGPEHGSQIVRKASQLGLDRELVPFSQGNAPALDASEFRAIISDGALSNSERVDRLIEALVSAANDGVRIAVSERVGSANSPTAREMGDRIWQLMPERYKFNRLTQQSESNYWVEGASWASESDLLSNLRAHFIFEDFASFGHLVDRFVGPEIGPNFNPEDDRDQRFIEQISNLDEAKLDSGALDPLHIVARLVAR